MDADAMEAGRTLYEERMAFLPGLWMPEAPAWEDLSEEDRHRWIRTALELEAGSGTDYPDE
ncbi:hypothetical protein [Arthrobacter yangruifuii]|uniref:hypothetical protein n=1 Tax=Arthrobacter yangruifuii TaxID=2606616 RepID=UPI0011B81F49|nr:hypothetical protein [Arthrobacter yangruifuii]